MKKAITISSDIDANSFINFCLFSKKIEKANEDGEMKDYAKTIIDDSQNKDPILSILEIIQEKCKYGDELNKLTNGEKTIYLIGDVEGEVNNGGFSQYFFNSSGKNAKEAILALKSINATYTASLLEQAMEIYKNGPTTYSYSEPEEGELSEGQQEKLNELDTKFYEYKENLSGLQIKYIKDHISEF